MHLKTWEELINFQGTWTLTISALGMIHLQCYLLVSVSWVFLVGSQMNVEQLEMNSWHGKQEAFPKERVLISIRFYSFVLLSYLLRNLCLSNKGGENGKTIWALRLKATIDRCRRLADEYSEAVLQIFPQKVQVKLKWWSAENSAHSDLFFMSTCSDSANSVGRILIVV